MVEPRDEGGRSLLVSALLHACVIGLFFLAPPGTPALSLGDTYAEPLRAHLLATIQMPSSTSGSTSGSTSTSTSTPPSPSPSPSISGSPSRSISRSHASSSSRAPTADPLGSLAALALALDAAASPAFVAQDALAHLSGNGVDTSGAGFDMVGTGRGTGGDGGGTIGAPAATAWGMAGSGATCSGPMLEERTLRMGRIAAVESCAAANTFGGMRAAGFGTRTSASRRAPDELEASPRRGRVHTCSATCVADVHGSLSRDVVRSIVARHRAEIRACYEGALVARPDLEGRVTAAFQIAPSGRVQSSTIDAQRSDLQANAVETCVAQAVARWSFPSSGGPTLVSYPFVLGTEG